jgi:hypothetical protein
MQERKGLSYAACYMPVKYYLDSGNFTCSVSHLLACFVVIA